jgi:hypothetical protein
LFSLHVRANGILLGCGLDCNLGSKQINVSVNICRFRQPGPGQLWFTLVIAAGYDEMIYVDGAQVKISGLWGEVVLES